MKVERLTFQVVPWAFAKDFLQVDSEVWNPWLKRQPGFLNKTSRLLENGMVELNIFWKDADSVDRAASKKSEMLYINSLMRNRCPGQFSLVSSMVV